MVAACILWWAGAHSLAAARLAIFLISKMQRGSGSWPKVKNWRTCGTCGKFEQNSLDAHGNEDGHAGGQEAPHKQLLDHGACIVEDAHAGSLCAELGGIGERLSIGQLIGAAMQ